MRASNNNKNNMWVLTIAVHCSKWFTCITSFNLFFKVFFFFNVGHLKKLFNGCDGSVAACGHSLIAVSGGYSSLQFPGFSLVVKNGLLMRWAQKMQCRSLVALRHVGSSGPMSRRPMSPALAGGFLSTIPPWKSWCGPFKKSLLNLLQYCFCFGCVAVKHVGS